MLQVVSALCHRRRIMGSFFYYLSTFLLSFSFLSAWWGGDSTLAQKGMERYSHKVASYEDDLPGRRLFVTLENGTRWIGWYKYPVDRARILHQWQPGKEIFISAIEGCRDWYVLYGEENNIERPYLYVTLDLNTANRLPKIESHTKKGTLQLSDGSEWKENKWFYSSKEYWEEGERVIVARVSKGKYVLMNIDVVDSHNGSYPTHEMEASLVAIHEKVSPPEAQPEETVSKIRL